MNIVDYLPIIVRYLLVSLASMMAARGLIDGDQSAIINQQVDTVVPAIIAIGTLVYALVKRPSQKALDAAKAIDKQLPAKADVVIQTPEGKPDIVIPAKTAS